MISARITFYAAFITAAVCIMLTQAQPNMSPGGVRLPMGPNAPRIPAGRPPTGRSSTGRSSNPMMNLRPDSRQRRPGSGGFMQQTSTCAAAGRAAVAQCFKSNGGFQMQYVVSLLSNGTQGPLPRNAEQMKKRICSSEGSILSCVFSSVSNLQNTQRCPTVSEYIRLEQEAVGLISGMQQMCGKGPLPPPSPCLRDLDANIGECYTKVGLNKDMFNPSGLASDPGKASKIIGAVIGENAQVAKKFCRVKKRLFDCMKTIMDKCPGSMELTALSGYDHESMKKGIDVLCHDINNYVDGLKCFQTPPPEVSRCYTTLVNGVTNLTAQQLQRSMSTPEFYSRFCQMKIQHMDCDLKSWREKCEAKAVGLKNEYECNLLPTTCKNDKVVQRQLQQTCAVSRFQRQLRSGVAPIVSTSGLLISAITFVILFIL